MLTIISTACPDVAFRSFSLAFDNSVAGEGMTSMRQTTFNLVSRRLCYEIDDFGFDGKSWVLALKSVTFSRKQGKDWLFLYSPITRDEFLLHREQI